MQKLVELSESEVRMALAALVADLLEVDVDRVQGDEVFADLNAEFDSLSAIQIQVEVEERYGLTLTLDDDHGFPKTLSDLVSLVMRCAASSASLAGSKSGPSS